MGWGTAVAGGLKDVWERVSGSMQAKAAEGERKTVASPWVNSILSPLVRTPGREGVLPKATATNLRRFAETPPARRAINFIKNRIASMEWRIESIPGLESDAAEARRRASTLTRALRCPNETDSFQTLLEQMVEDLLVMGAGAIEMESTHDASQPVKLYPVDGASVQINPTWNGSADEARFAQVNGKMGTEGLTPLRDDELMYVRLNPRTHTVFGLGKMEVAFESISQFLQTHRFAGRMASHGVMQYALWLNERTPEQHERLIRWWQDEVEGSGRVPVLSSEQKPEVLRFAGGTDEDLHLQWQEFLLGMIANAFDLPPMLLGVVRDVNRSTAKEMADEAFQNAIVPLAKLIAEHLTRDVLMKRLGWDDLRFVWNELDSRDEGVEADMQIKLLAAGVLSIDEVRAMRGLPARSEQQAL